MMWIRKVGIERRELRNDEGCVGEREWCIDARMRRDVIEMYVVLRGLEGERDVGYNKNGK